MFTITEIIEAMPPNLPISTSQYWQDVLQAAERYVKGLTGRRLEADIYTDYGWTIAQVFPDRIRYVYYLAEPTGEAIPYASFTTLKLNDETVAESDVIIEPERLIFKTPGRVDLTYPGGYMRNETAKAQIRQAVIYAMMLIHNRGQMGGLDTIPLGGITARADDNAETILRRMVSPFIRQYVSATNML